MQTLFNRTFLAFCLQITVVEEKKKRIENRVADGDISGEANPSAERSATDSDDMYGLPDINSDIFGAHLVILLSLLFPYFVLTSDPDSLMFYLVLANGLRCHRVKTRPRPRRIALAAL